MKLPYGENIINLDLDELGGKDNNLLLPNEVTLTKQITETQINIVKSSLNSPIKQYNIKSWYKNDEKMVIIIPDITRNCSQSIYLTEIIKYMEFECELNRDNILIIVATGNHRACKDDELKKLVGDYVYRNYKITNHNSVENLSFMGTTQRGNKIFINKYVADADKILVTGNITYHNFAGFSGGRKSILPGVAGRDTILYNHRLMVNKGAMHEKCQLGLYEENPIHEDMIEAVKLLDPKGEKIYSLNVTTNMYGQIIAAFSGRMEDVFKAGIEYVESNYKIDVAEKGDVVLCSSGGYPYDINFYQSFKSLYSANKITKKDGYLFLLTESRDGLGESFDKFKFWFSMDMPEIINELSRNFDVVGQIAYWTKYAVKNYKLFIVTKDDNFESFNSIGLYTISLDSFRDKLSLILKSKSDHKIFSMPYANITCFKVKNN